MNSEVAKKVKWTKEEILTLIDAYKQEPCLYAIKSINYHNKTLRTAALQRIGNAVRSVYNSNKTNKDCQIKFNNLRTTFHLENNKRKASQKRGVGTNDTYLPGLWYFKHLLFLGEYFAPRKNRLSPMGTMSIPSTSYYHMTDVSNMSTEFDNKETAEYSANQSFGIGVTNDGKKNEHTHLTIPIKEEDLDEENSLTTLDISREKLLEPVAVAVAAAAASAATTSNFTPSPTSSSQTSTSNYSFTELSAVNSSPSLKVSCIRALESIAESLKQPILSQVARKPSDSVDHCIQFIGSILREIKHEKIRMELMSNLIKTTIDAKSADLQIHNHE